MPVAGDDYRLFSEKDAEGDLFRKVLADPQAPQGTGSHQGNYLVAPSGRLLAFSDSLAVTQILDAIDRGWQNWQKLPDAERYLTPTEQKGVERVAIQKEGKYPVDGLVLRINSRDLPRPKGVPQTRPSSWNQDFAWFTRDEAKQWIPAGPGVTVALPTALAVRLADLSLVDSVRGQDYPYDPSGVSAHFFSTLTGRQGMLVSLELKADVELREKGVWPLEEGGLATSQSRGMSLTGYGLATYDEVAQRFTDFQLVLTGTRWGGTVDNSRQDDLGPQPIGFAFLLASPNPLDRTPPAFLRYYGPPF